MYNSITENKIRQIPQIGNIDNNRLPQELTRIYAQIVTLRRQLISGTINLESSEFGTGINTLQALANNLETILIANSFHEQKEAIAFVAATAHALIEKIRVFIKYELDYLLEVDTISPYLSCIVLFLIGNSQADAAEIATRIINNENDSATKKKLVTYIQALGMGHLTAIVNNPPVEDEISSDDLQEIALDYLWKDICSGIYTMAVRLTNSKIIEEENNFFDRVINLSVSDNNFLGQRSIFTGPYHLSKLLKILEADIFNRAVIRIPPPKGIDSILWYNFLETLAKDRPYLWENHKDAVNTNFLEPGISAVLTLPTGAGKTTLSELKIASCLFSGKKVIYLVPTHALEDQSKRNLKALFREYETTDIEIDSEYTEAETFEQLSISVMTPERCLTLLNINPDFFTNVGLIVFDEFHLINGTSLSKERRAIDAMYCLLLLFSTCSNADYLLISAMVENGNDIADWLQQVLKRECKLFNSSWKPTRQLHGCLVFEEKSIIKLNNQVRTAFKSKTTSAPPTRLRKALTISPSCFFSLRNIWETVDDNDYYQAQILEEEVLLGINNSWKLTTNRNDVAAKLAVHFSMLGLKTLIFVDDPRITQSTAEKINRGLSDKKNNYKEYNKRNKSLVESLAMELGNIQNSYFDKHENCGVHHGLLLPLERNLIENYFKENNGSIALAATATLAQGVNLPAEIVIIAGDDRFNEDSNYREQIPPHELLNAAGRAGRAGQSSQGAVILIPGEIVTIKESTISDRWWTLKNEVFSRSDQCLKVEDPLEYFLDSIQDESKPLSIEQTNTLYRFKAENLSEAETKKILQHSFYAYKAAKENNENTFNAEVEKLIKRRNELDTLSEDIAWIKEISFKTGIDPNLVLELSNAIDKEDLVTFLNLSVSGYINWFFDWLEKTKNSLNRIYTKQATINQIKRATGIKQEDDDIDKVYKQLSKLKELLLKYINGDSLQVINKSISETNDIYLSNARNFVMRLIPDLSFSFGLLSFIVVEKAQQQSIQRKEIPITIRMLATCVREGFDEVEKYFYKQNNRLRSRVEANIKFSNK